MRKKKELNLNRKPIFRWLLIAALLGAATGANAFQHPNDLPAERHRLAAKSPLLAVTQAGDRLVAAGLRGMIVYSDDQGKTWTQAQSPVSSDLVALSFPSPQQGWAVGHGGIVLHTSNGGATWDKQLDGAKASQLAIASFESRAANDPAAARLLEDEKGLLVEGNGMQPFFDVYFANDKQGYIVGAFNRIFRTEDGGVTWQPLMAQTDNPDALHFYSITGDGGGAIYLAGEQGKVWRLDQATQRFVKIPTPYSGTLFGVVTDGQVVFAYGMRGSLFRSENEGGAWSRVEVDANSKAGVTRIAVLPNKALALVTQGGGLYMSNDLGLHFTPVKASNPMNYYGVHAVGKDQVVLSGSGGVRVEALQ
jgi:photosystem II stability/assembly factor-like uncharacterized protein